MNHISKNT